MLTQVALQGHVVVLGAPADEAALWEGQQRYRRAIEGLERLYKPRAAGKGQRTVIEGQVGNCKESAQEFRKLFTFKGVEESEHDEWWKGQHWSGSGATMGNQGKI